MAALSQTAANVTLGSQAILSVDTGGEAITQGMPVCLDSGTNKYYRADANVVGRSRATGIAMTPCTGDNALFIVAQGVGFSVNVGATLVVGETYCVGNVVGQIVPIADLTTGDYPCILGTATTTALMTTLFAYTGVAKT